MKSSYHYVTFMETIFTQVLSLIQRRGVVELYLIPNHFLSIPEPVLQPKQKFGRNGHIRSVSLKFGLTFKVKILQVNVSIQLGCKCNLNCRPHKNGNINKTDFFGLQLSIILDNSTQPMSFFSVFLI